MADTYEISGTPIEIRPRKYDVTITLYSVPGSLLSIIRNSLIALLPANVDFAFSPNEVTDDG